MATWDIGAPVAAFSWKSASPRAQLLLMHGLGEYSERYLTYCSELIPKLNQQGIDVYAFDLPGHGRTAGERGLVDVTQGVALHLQARSRLPVGLPTVLFGHSLGGLITGASIVRQHHRRNH
jgi:acylglycerol lipase